MSRGWPNILLIGSGYLFVSCWVQVSGLPPNIVPAHIRRLVSCLATGRFVPRGLFRLSALCAGMYSRLSSGSSCKDRSSSECSMSHMICATMSSAIALASCSLASSSCSGGLGGGWAIGCLIRSAPS